MPGLNWEDAAHTDEVWKTSAVASAYLEGVRAAIPLAQEQLDVMLRLLERVAGRCGIFSTSAAATARSAPRSSSASRKRAACW